MILSKEIRIEQLKSRIKKLNTNPMVNANLIKKAERQIRKLST